MDNTVRDILEFVKENDVRFIRLAFLDLFGMQKNISILPDELAAAFESGRSFDANAIAGFADARRSDLLLYPDPTTLQVLPWRPQQGRVVRFYCDVRRPGGAPYGCDTRAMLKRATERCQDMGYSCSLGAECEFYLFKTDDSGAPTMTPLDRGGYLDVYPLDMGENVRREVCLTLLEMGVKVESSHHEQGPGQNEIGFRFADGMESADNLTTFKTVVKSVAGRSGLFASFLPKPLEQQSGSGLHLNLSLHKGGQNLFAGEMHPDAKSFLAGVLGGIREITLFLNQIANSYERLGACEAPRYVSWSHQNRSQLVRIPAAEGERARMELRSPDPACNPHLAFALVLEAGLDGIAKRLPLPAAVDEDLFTAGPEITSRLAPLPMDMGEALQLAEGSELAARVMGADALGRFLAIKRDEQRKEPRQQFEKWFRMI